MAISAAKLMVEVGADTRDAEGKITSFGDKLNKSAQQMGVTGGLLTAGITAPLVGIATAALTSASEFEQNLNIVQQVIGATASEMEAMQAEALRLGAVTSFSAGEASAAMLELGKAGMSSEEILASIEGVMNLAAAGGLGLAESAGYVATSLNAFGLAASEATRIADLFSAGANASSADVADLAKGVQNAGFAFAAAGWPIEDLVASMAMLTNVGLTASDASTALKNAIMQMISPTDQAKALAEELGLAFFDAQGTMLSLPTILDNINAATAGMTDEQRNAALSTMFMSDGMKALIPLLDAGSAGFNETLDAVTQTGAAGDTAAARMKGLSGGIEYLKGSVDSFLIGAALPFLAILNDLAIQAGDAVTWFGTLPEPVLNASLAFLAVLAAAGPLALAIAAVTAALGFLLSPIGLVIAGAALLAAAWASNFGGIQEKTQAVIDAVLPALTSLWTGAQEVASGIATAFSNTTFPTIGELWADFQAGDYEAIAEKIKSTAYELMVNLDAELDITGKAQDLRARLKEGSDALDKWGEDMIVGATEKLNATDWSQVTLNITSLISQWTQQISSIDWTAMGAQLGANLRAALTQVFGGTEGNAEQQAIADNFKNAVVGAFTSIDWSLIGTALGKLAGVVGTALSDLLSGLFSSLGAEGSMIEFEQPGWITDLLAWNIDDPQWAIDLMAWVAAVPEWLDGMLDWKAANPDWLQGMLDWEAITPDWLQGMLDWEPSTPDWLSNLLNWEPSMPGWVSRLLSWVPSIPGFAAGTSSAPAGLALVGERGPEIVALPSGARVYSNRESRGMLAGAGAASVIVRIENVTIANDMDVHRTATVLGREVVRRMGRR